MIIVMIIVPRCWHSKEQCVASCTRWHRFNVDALAISIKQPIILIKQSNVFAIAVSMTKAVRDVRAAANGELTLRCVRPRVCGLGLPGGVTRGNSDIAATEQRGGTHTFQKPSSGIYL
jgi:hypothetical protein